MHRLSDKLVELRSATGDAHHSESESDSDLDMFCENNNIIPNLFQDNSNNDTLKEEPQTIGENDQNSNNLKFYPYSNNRMTRSVATLNLSLSNQRLADLNLNLNLNAYSSPSKSSNIFNNGKPSTPLNKSPNKLKLYPIPTPFNFKNENEHRERSNTSSNSNNNNNTISYNIAKPDPNAFNPKGLISKTSNLSATYPNKIKIPNTPMKKSPRIDHTSLNTNTNDNDTEFTSIFNESFPSNNINNNTGLSFDTDENSLSKNLRNNILLQSPSLKRVPLIQISNNHQSAKKDYHSQLFDYPQLQFHSSNNDNNNKFKKIKKSRNSTILNNSDLTNTLQQFTDDLYGSTDLNTNNNNTSNPTSPSFFQNSTNNNDNNNSNVHYDEDNDPYEYDDLITTPTRRKSISILKQTPSSIKSIPPLINSPVLKRRYINATISTNPDSHLFEKFNNVHMIGSGQFSSVYQVTFAPTNKKYAVKAVKANKYNSLNRILQEIKILDEIRTSQLDLEGKEYVIDFISSWKYQGSFYIMSEYYDNGNLDSFLQEQIISKNTRLEDWRIWKIIVELSLALRFIHQTCHVVHLDLKPTNILITFEGNLKLADFGMAAHLPLRDQDFENEGDREYIAPEIISECIYDFKADIFSLGLMIVEIAANVVLPDNGNAWHKLRSGDLSDAGKLSSSNIHSESLFSSNNKVDTNLTDISSIDNNHNNDRSISQKRDMLCSGSSKI